MYTLFLNPFHLNKRFLLFLFGFSIILSAYSQGTRLLRQPTISNSHIAFIHGGDLWISEVDGKNILRLTSTPAIETNPQFSPDGKFIAFSSNRSGNNAVYIVPIAGGEPKRLTWHPSSSNVRGWMPDGTKVIYATTRGSAPTSINRLWSVSIEGGPSSQISAQWGYDGTCSSDGSRIVIDRVSRWESEFRGYRGGQNPPLPVFPSRRYPGSGQCCCPAARRRPARRRAGTRGIAVGGSKSSG